MSSGKHVGMQIVVGLAGIIVINKYINAKIMQAQEYLSYENRNI